MRAISCLGGLWAAFCNGCSSMSDIDRKIERTVLNQNEMLGMDAAPPRLRPPSPDDSVERTRYEKTPPTTNPDADQLRYTPAQKDRDVLERLEQYSAEPADAERLTLEDVLGAAQSSAREYLNAEEEYIVAAIRLLAERHLWSPRFFDDLEAAIGATAPPGSNYQTALNVINTLRVQQRLPYGGDVEARLITRATQQLTEIVGEQYVQSSALVLEADVPLLRNAGLIAQEALIQSERNLVYAARDFEDFRRGFFVDIASEYFSLLAQQSRIRNQVRRLESVRLLLEQTRALVDAGRERPFQARNVEQNLLSSRNDLINARENYILSLDRFKVRLGIPVERRVALLPFSLDLDDPEIGVNEASDLALRYRLDYQNEIDQVDDARRDVANARNQLLPDLNVAASTTLNTDPDSLRAGVSFDAEEADYAASVLLSLPLDREIERLALRETMIRLEQQKRSLEQFRDELILEARQSVREIDRARLSLRLQEDAVRINELRLEEIRIKQAEVDPQTRLDAENELLDSRNERDEAVRDLRIAILRFLERTGQLRVEPSGRLKPLPGMELRLLPIDELSDVAADEKAQGDPSPSSVEPTPAELEPPAGTPEIEDPVPPPPAEDDGAAGGPPGRDVPPDGAQPRTE
ncbi:MAG: TolC family protein [Planctomycetota bacterium]|nr:TolC family protein [Planctomycetota bacterium]